MRLRLQDDHVEAQFSFPGELAALATKEACWLPLYLPADVKHPIGAIHSSTHEVRLRSGLVITDRQVVVLGPTPMSEFLDGDQRFSPEITRVPEPMLPNLTISSGCVTRDRPSSLAWDSLQSAPVFRRKKSF